MTKTDSYYTHKEIVTAFDKLLDDIVVAGESTGYHTEWMVRIGRLFVDRLRDGTTDEPLYEFAELFLETVIVASDIAERWPHGHTQPELMNAAVRSGQHPPPWPDRHVPVTRPYVPGRVTDPLFRRFDDIAFTVAPLGMDSSGSFRRTWYEHLASRYLLGYATGTNSPLSPWGQFLVQTVDLFAADAAGITRDSYAGYVAKVDDTETTYGGQRSTESVNSEILRSFNELVKTVAAGEGLDADEMPARARYLQSGVGLAEILAESTGNEALYAFLAFMLMTVDYVVQDAGNSVLHTCQEALARLTIKDC